MSFYGNGLKKNYPIATTRAQNTSPPTLLLGVGFNKLFARKETSAWEAQLDLSYAIQNVTPRLATTDKDWVQFKGFSPGVTINYFMQLGKSKISDYYGHPMLLNHNLCFHVGTRPLFYDMKEANGILVEMGIAYRMGLFSIKSYKLKEDYFWK